MKILKVVCSFIVALLVCVSAKADSKVTVYFNAVVLVGDVKLDYSDDWDRPITIIESQAAKAGWHCYRSNVFKSSDGHLNLFIGCFPLKIHQQCSQKKDAEEIADCLAKNVKSSVGVSVTCSNSENDADQSIGKLPRKDKGPEIVVSVSCQTEKSNAPKPNDITSS